MNGKIEFRIDINMSNFSKIQYYIYIYYMILMILPLLYQQVSSHNNFHYTIRTEVSL